MEQEEIINFIVRELAKSHRPRDIVMDVCERTKMSWPEAEKLVRHVQATRGREVAARQSPMLIAFCVGLLLLGVGGIFVGMVTLSDEGERARSSIQYIVTGIGMVLGGIIGLWNTIAAYLNGK